MEVRGRVYVAGCAFGDDAKRLTGAGGPPSCLGVVATVKAHEANVGIVCAVLRLCPNDTHSFTSNDMNPATKDAERAVIDSYVTDLLALETHIQTALSGQIQVLDEHNEFKGPLIRIQAFCESHVNALQALTTRREQNVGGVSKVVKKAVSSVLGLGAAAIGMVRTEKLPKDLRDDYTALSLAYIGALMLHTTAITLKDTDVADLARTMMNDHASSMMVLQHIVPAATVSFLASEGMDVDVSVLPEIASTIHTAWT